MKRYVTRPRIASINDGPDAENYLAHTVYEPEPHQRDTGLLDAGGNKIFAMERMDRIGFVRDIEEH